jgi:eukaryotic-like serine/threonine-protein kinase
MKLSQVTAFLNEAIQVRNFAHPNIVTTYGGDIDGDIYYIVQEWICGFDLANYEDKIARFTLPQLLFIMLKTTEALEYMWTNFKFVHRDIKPENILINNKGRVILTDFGIMSPELECDMNDSLQCTPHYVPPETVTGEGKIDFRSDIYSLGATFFKLISGKTPFYGTSAIGVIEQRIFMPPPDLRAHAEVSDAVAEMIMTCMAISASDRYQNFNYLKNALRRCMSNLNPPKAIKMTKTNYVR